MRTLMTAASACLITSIVCAQSPVPVKTTLDVASVKRRDPADWTNINVANRPGGTVVATNFPLPGLIALAYRVQRSQVIVVDAIERPTDN